MITTLATTLGDEHATGVLDVLLYLDQESDGLPAVEKSVVVGERQVHHGADFNLAVDRNGPLLDGMQTKDSYTRSVRHTGSLRKDYGLDLPVWGRLMMGVPYREPKTPP